MVDYVYSFFYSSVMVFLEIQFGKAFCSSREISWWIKILLYVEWVCALFSLSYFTHDIILRLLLIICLSFIHYLILFKTTALRGIVLSVISTSLLTVTDFAVYSLKFIISPGMNINTIFEYTISYYLSFGSQLLQLISIIFITRLFSKTDAINTSTKTWLRYLIVPFSSLFFISLIVITMDNDISEKMGTALVVFAIGLILLNIYIYYFLKNDVNREIESEKTRALYHHAEELQTIYGQLSVERDKLAKDSHEFKNKIVAWTNLLNAGEYSELSKMMGKESSKNLYSSNVFSTGNSPIDVVLNAKYYEAVSKGITFDFNLNNLSDIHIDGTDLIILLSNIMNNAIEACEKFNCDPKISIKGIIKMKRFIFTVRNTYDGVLNDGLDTTKENKSLHGFGIEAIKNIVNKYNGKYYTDYDDQWFTTYIIIPL